MKKWNINALLYNDNSNFTYSFTVPFEDATVTLFNDQVFRSRVLYKYTSWCISSPKFYDNVSDQYIDTCPAITDAISLLHDLFTQWVTDRQHAFTRMYAALVAEYNPLWNVDGVEGLVSKANHTGTDVNAKAGKDTTQASGSDVSRLSGRDQNSLSGSDTLKKDINREETTRTGYELREHDGDDTDSVNVATFDSNGNLAPERENNTHYNSDEKTTYGNVKDAHSLDATDKTTYGKVETADYGKVDTMQHGRKDETTYNSSNTETRNLIDDYIEMKIRQGNIGVTKSTDLVESELQLRDKWDHLLDYFISDFIHTYCIL